MAAAATMFNARPLATNERFFNSSPNQQMGNPKQIAVDNRARPQWVIGRPAAKKSLRIAGKRTLASARRG
jgi:hypothetical protein